MKTHGIDYDFQILEKEGDQYGFIHECDDIIIEVSGDDDDYFKKRELLRSLFFERHSIPKDPLEMGAHFIISSHFAETSLDKDKIFLYYSENELKYQAKNMSNMIYFYVLASDVLNMIHNEGDFSFFENSSEIYETLESLLDYDAALKKITLLAANGNIGDAAKEYIQGETTKLLVFYNNF